ncbi:unnamed protein product [Heterobilharzia americana]|nr:unnamed protein product [Heterobilharzia americana]
MPNVVKAKSHLNPVGKNNLSGDNTSATTSTTTITTTTTATTISSSDSKKLEKDINLDIPPTTTNVQTKLTDSTKASSHNLEVLFDRLIRLREPHLAIRMSEILLYYISPKSPDSLERKNKSNSSMLNNSNRAVKVIHDNPKLIAFDLRKLPTSCIDKLTALIKEDEEISKKQNQTSAPSKSNMIKNYVCQNKTVVTRGYDWFDNVESSYQNSNHRDFSERENF